VVAPLKDDIEDIDVVWTAPSPIVGGGGGEEGVRPDAEREENFFEGFSASAPPAPPALLEPSFSVSLVEGNFLDESFDINKC